jgi:GTP-binding protein
MKHPLQQARFAYTVANDAQLPPPGPPEVAFAGRSNAGKSSAINTLANQTRLAFTSKTPGRTQQINFFELRNGTLLADLPGYGYAAVPQELKRHWQEFLARYLATRQSLVGLVLVVDARHGLADLDVTLLEGYLPSSRPVLVLATKMDKLAPSAQRTAARDLARDLAARFPEHAGRMHVIGFSATRRLGVAEAEALLGSWLGLGDDPVAAHAGAPEKKRPRDQGE